MTINEQEYIKLSNVAAIGCALSALRGVTPCDDCGVIPEELIAITKPLSELHMRLLRSMETVETPVLSDDEILAMWLNEGGTFSGVESTEDGNISHYDMTEERIIKFIRSLL